MPYYNRKFNTANSLNDIKVVAEIGVRAGYSAKMFILGSDAEEFVGFDCYNTVHEKDISNGDLQSHANKLLKETKCKSSVIILDTQKTESLLSYFPKGVDFFHIDADHTIEGVTHDLELALEVLNPNGRILVDDVGQIDSEGKILYGAALVRNATERFAQKHKLSCAFIDTLTGELLLWRA
jgi:predicted O-methyltransferase YrrM